MFLAIARVLALSVAFCLFYSSFASAREKKLQALNKRSHFAGGVLTAPLIKIFQKR